MSFGKIVGFMRGRGGIVKTMRRLKWAFLWGGFILVALGLLLWAFFSSSLG